MVLALEALGVDLIDVFGTGGPGGKPSVLCHYFYTSNSGSVGRSFCQRSRYCFAGEFSRNGGRVERRKAPLLFRRRGDVDPGVVGRPELGSQFVVMLTRVLAGGSGDFSGQEVEDDAVFVGGPNSAFALQKTGSGTF